MGFFSDIAPIASLAAGVYTGNPGLIAGGLGALGSSAQGQAAQQGNQQAAQLTQFRPVGITNTFGTSNFGFDPATGQMTSAGYNLSPTLQGAQNSLTGGFGTNLQDQANIQAMGRQYMAQSPQEAAQQWMNQQQAILQPSRDMAQANLNTSMFNSGTGGLSVAQGTGMASANPQQQALANAQALQNLQLAGQAQQQGQNQYTFGQGLLSSSYDPYNAGLKASAATEQLGQNPFTMSTNLAQTASGANVNSAGYLKNATSYSPTGSLLSGLAGNTQFTNGIGSLFGNGDPTDPTGNAYGGVSNGWVQAQSAAMPSNNNFGNPALAWD
jgi:hypothetical protein